MKIWHIADDDYWGVIPPGDEVAATLAAAGQQQGLKSSIHALGDPADEGHPVAAVVAYPPNYVLPRHSHDSDRLEIVISGSAEVAGRRLGPGDMWTSIANQFYGPHKFGAEGCTTLELLCASGARRVTFDTGDTPLDVDFGDSTSVAAAADFFQQIAG